MLISGILGIIFAISNKKGVPSGGWYMGFDILAIFCSLLILWLPAVGALYAVYMISSTFLII
ncbi:hypothetical protein JCM10556A_05180 [Bacteroides acidifaciens]